MTKDAMALDQSDDQRDKRPLLRALHAPGPDARLADKLALFGQFMGSWMVGVSNHFPDGRDETVPAAWHFGWVLQGRAVQDVLISPPDQGAEQRGTYRECGTTLRFYDESIDAWRVTWSGPVRGRQILLVGLPRQDQIVLEGVEGSVKLQWIFSDIGPASFHWRALESEDEGVTWRLVQEMTARRAHKHTPSRGPGPIAVESGGCDTRDADASRATDS